MKIKMTKIGRRGKNLSNEGRYLIEDSNGELRLVFIDKSDGGWHISDCPRSNYLRATILIDKEEANYSFFGPIETT